MSHILISDAHSIYICIYIERERETERDIERERETERDIRLHKSHI